MGTPEWSMSRRRFLAGAGAAAALGVAASAGVRSAASGAPPGSISALTRGPGLVVHPTPTGAPPSGWECAVNGQATWTYATNFGFKKMGSIASFDHDGSAPLDVVVHAPVNVTRAWVRPASRRITPQSSGRSITFRIPADFYGHLLVAVNSELPDNNTLLISVRPIETAPSPSSVTRYFGPGVHNDVGVISLNSNQSLYLAPGALVRGIVRAGTGSTSGPRSSNIRIFGRGVLDSTGYTRDPGRPMRVNRVDGCKVEGIAAIGVKHWGVVTEESTNVDYRYIAVLNDKDAAGAGTPDGWDVLGSSRVTLRDSFVRSHDDGSAIKSTKNGWKGSVSDITYERNFFVQGDGGNGIEIGYENGEGFTTRNITYRDMDIIKTARRDPYRRSAIGVHQTGGSSLSNVLWEDIRVENTTGKVMENQLWVGSFFTSDYPSQNRAQISNLTFRRISWPGGSPLVLTADSASAPIRNVVFDRCTVAGKPLTRNQVSAKNAEFTIED
jgi:hypothetical protein